MATSGMHISIVGDSSGVTRALNHLDAKLSTPMMMGFLAATIHPWLQERARQRFLNEGDDASGKWAPLQQSTNEWRRSGGFPEAHPINKRTGELERFITGSSALVTPTPAGVTMKYPGSQPSGGLFEKVKTAQRGRKTPSTVPRPVLSLGLADLNFTLSSLALYIQAGGTP